MGWDESKAWLRGYMQTMARWSGSCLGDITRVQGFLSQPSLFSLWDLGPVINFLGLHFPYLKSAYSR